MNDERLFSMRNPWFVGSLAGVVAIDLLSVFIGFLFIPYAQSDKTLAG
ncbi:hypothetical protein SAMN06265795_109122 [Noviherbaspirillum humi]|uniref:Uncharacterized protein n=1 Tax=Noviherbaspirillum humi TaxID=1688639 RepID=A0A239IHZ7_9BURK|nr:hypothetical protein [Noviherbaspirillum humi]SNS93237.1 hypothetical protein SAMN06265795_109122 [Noviherbaspirillum humi]